MTAHGINTASSGTFHTEDTPGSPLSQDEDSIPRDEEHNKEGVSKDQATPDVIPNGGYGWVCVGTCFMINAHTWGINGSYGVFLNYYITNDTFPGATRLQFAFVGGLSIGLAMFISPIVTYLVRKIGTTPTLLIGVFFETLSLIAASFAKSIWQLSLSQGVCFAIGLGHLFVGSVGVVPQWFTTRRSLANGIAAAGSGFGGLIYSLGTNAMIQSVGLPWAFRILAIVTLVVNLTSSILIKDRNKQIGTSHIAFDVKLLKKYEFWLVQGYGFFSMLGYVVLLFSLPNYAHTVGLTSKQGSILGAILNLGQGLGRPPIGYFSDWIGRFNMAGMMTFLSGAFALVIWINAKSYGVLIFYALLGGTVAGTYWATIAPVAAEVIALQDLPSALSIIWVTLTFPLLFAEPIALEIVSYNNGSYLGTQIFCGVMYIAAAVCLWLLKAWKMAQPEKRGLEESSDAAPPAQSRSSFLRRLVILRKV